MSELFGFIGKEVYEVRKKLGEILAHKIMVAGIDAEAVIPISETARPSAIALARHLGVDYEEGFVKQEGIDHSLITFTQRESQKNLENLAPISSVFKSKSVILVDDRIVTGTASRKAIQLAHEAGATKVYLASTHPGICHPSNNGIDFADPTQQLANKKSLSEIAEAVDVDALICSDEKDLIDAIGSDKLSSACLSGVYTGHGS